jgi:hypothetical protein
MKRFGGYFLELGRRLINPGIRLAITVASFSPTNMSSFCTMYDILGMKGYV